MGHHTLLARSHVEGLVAEYAAHDLHKRHVARQFVNVVDLAAVYIFIRIILQQVAIRLNAQFLTEQLLAIRPYAWQVHDVLLQYVHYYSGLLLLITASAMFRSPGVVILMFSRLPSTSVTVTP